MRVRPSEIIAATTTSAKGARRMDAFMKLSREAQVVIGGAVLLLIISFFDWQQVSSSGDTQRRRERVAWRRLPRRPAHHRADRVGGRAPLRRRLGRLARRRCRLRGLALLVALFTVIYFLTHTDRAALAGVGRPDPRDRDRGRRGHARSQAEGVQMPAMGEELHRRAAPPRPAAAWSDSRPAGESTALVRRQHGRVRRRVRRVRDVEPPRLAGGRVHTARPPERPATPRRFRRRSGAALARRIVEPSRPLARTRRPSTRPARRGGP